MFDDLQRRQQQTEAAAEEEEEEEEKEEEEMEEEEMEEEEEEEMEEEEMEEEEEEEMEEEGGDRRSTGEGGGGRTRYVDKTSPASFTPHWALFSFLSISLGVAFPPRLITWRTCSAAAISLADGLDK